MFLASAFSRSEVPPEIHSGSAAFQVDFVTDTELRSALGATSATQAQVDEAVAINADARLRALRAAFLIVGGISLLAVFPAARLPKYVPGELSADDIVSEREPEG
jgi:hypothetical protein